MAYHTYVICNLSETLFNNWVRPVQFTGGLITQHPQSQALQNVVEAVALIKPLVKVMQGLYVKELGQETQETIKYEQDN